MEAGINAMTGWPPSETEMKQLGRRVVGGVGKGPTDVLFFSSFFFFFFFLLPLLPLLPAALFCFFRDELLLLLFRGDFRLQRP